MVAGYFFPQDFFPKSTYPNSNERKMIYINSRINTNPGTLGWDVLNDTIAHEMMHLINFALSVAKRLDGNLVYELDIWIDEGLAGAAEWVWSGVHREHNWRHYNEDPTGMIARGNNFFVWGNHISTNPAAILDDYATAYLFFHWLRLQAGNTGIYRNIAYSRFYDLQAVTTAANTVMPGRSYNDWRTLLKTWLAANYINAPTGPYGYRNDPTLRQVQASYLAGSTSSFLLAPGEGIYTQKTSMPAETTFIKYAGLPERHSTAAPIDTGASEFSALLSYNVNTNDYDSPSPSDPFSAATVSMNETNARINTLSSRQSQLSAPRPVSIWDMLRLNEHEDELQLSRFRLEIKTNE